MKNKLVNKLINWYNNINNKLKTSMTKNVIYKNKCLGKIKNVNQGEYIIYDNNILLITSVNENWVRVQVVEEGSITKCAIFHNL